MFEAFKIGLRLTLVNQVSSGLLMLSSQFAALHKNVQTTQAGIRELEARLLSLKRMGLVGGAMAATGGFGLSLLRGPLEEAKKYQLEVAKFGALGVGEAVTRDAEKFARGMKTYGTSVRENLGLLRDAQTIFGDFEHAKMVTPLLAKMKFANEAMYGAEGAAMKEKSFMDMLKVIELRRGLSSETAFRSQANMVQQVLTATGGRVGADQYLNLIKTGGVAAKGINDDVFYYKLEPLIQELGGMRVGTGLMSAYQNLMLGRTSVQVAKELQRLGLLDPKHVEYNKIGMIKRVLPGGLKGGDTLASDPIQFLEKVLLPSFAAKGISSEKDVLQELGLVFSNRTASQLFSTIFLQMANIKKNEALNRGALSIDQLDATARTTATGKEIELHAKWRDVLRELGTAVLPIAIKAVEGLISVTKGVVAFAERFPTLTKALVIGFGVLSGLVATGGVLMLATAGFRALGLALSVMTLGQGGGMIAAAAGGLLKMGTAIAGLVSAQGVVALASALGGLGLKIAALIGPGSMLAASGLVGYGAGTLIHKAIEGTSVDNGIGYAAARVAAFFGSEDARDALRITSGGSLYSNTYGGSMYGGTVRGAAGNKTVQVHSVVKLNEREVGRAVTMHQVGEASRPPTGGGSFDTSMSPVPVRLTGGY